MQNRIFLMSYPKIFFLQNLHFGPIRWVPRWFWKILIIYSQNLHFNLVFLSIFWKLKHAYAEHMRNRFYPCWAHTEPIYFIAHWAYEKQISAHAQPAVKCEQFFHVQSMLSIPRTNFITHWAYAEPISLHAEHAQKCLKVEYLGRIEFDFQKSCVSQKNVMLVYL